MVFGVKFSGFIAWWLWRTVYLAKLPGVAKKLRVMVGWTLDLFFGKEIEQMITLAMSNGASRRRSERDRHSSVLVLQEACIGRMKASFRRLLRVHRASRVHQRASVCGRAPRCVPIHRAIVSTTHSRGLTLSTIWQR